MQETLNAVCEELLRLKAGADSVVANTRSSIQSAQFQGRSLAYAHAHKLLTECLGESARPQTLDAEDIRIFDFLGLPFPRRDFFIAQLIHSGNLPLPLILGARTGCKKNSLCGATAQTSRPQIQQNLWPVIFCNLSERNLKISFETNS